MNRLLGPLVLALALPGPLAAQVSDTVTARDPKGLSELLELTGFKPELGKDNVGDPKIDIEIGSYYTTIYFYGCDEKTHEGCDSLQFQASFDRKDPWPAAQAVEVARKWRFGGVYLDDEGDPVVTWDVVTGDGIPSKVFLQGVRSYGDTLGEVADMVFPEDGSQNTSGE